MIYKYSYLLVILLLLSGCTNKSTEYVFQYKAFNGGYGTSFYLNDELKIYSITAKHLINKDINTNYRDVYVEISDKKSGYKPSLLDIPIGFLKNEKGREKFPIRIVGYLDGKIIETSGYICGRVVGSKYDLIFTTAEMYQGMSGSPVLDSDNKVIGVAVQLLYGKGEAKSVCTPIVWALTEID